MKFSYICARICQCELLIVSSYLNNYFGFPGAKYWLHHWLDLLGNIFDSTTPPKLLNGIWWNFHNFVSHDVILLFFSVRMHLIINRVSNLFTGGVVLLLCFLFSSLYLLILNMYRCRHKCRANDNEHCCFL